MNKVYRVIWNTTLGRFDVTSELSTGRKKTKLASTKKSDENKSFPLNVLFSCIISAFSADAFADDLLFPAMTPQNSNYTVISSPTSLIQGGSNGFSSIAQGAIGYTKMTLRQASDAGIITQGGQYVDSDILKLGTKSQTISYVDKTTMSEKTVSVYDNNQFTVSNAADFSIPVSTPVGDNGQYVDKSLFSIVDGGTLDVNTGETSSTWMNNKANRLSAILKGSSEGKTTSAIFELSGNSTLNYNSKTVAELGNDNNNNSNSRYVANFIGGFKNANSKIGDFTITNLDEFRVYNTALQEAITAGKLSASDYESELKKGYDNTQKTIYIGVDIPETDATNKVVNRDRVAYIKADGRSATVNITSDADIELFNSDASLARLTNGATLNNVGTLGSVMSTLRGSYVVNATDSIVNNSGVIDAGTNTDMSTFNKYVTSGYNVGSGQHIGVLANGSTTLNNTGVINVAQRQDNAGTTAILTSGTARIINNGSINVAAGSAAPSNNGSYISQGVILQNSASLENNGDIYVGRMAQRKVGETTADVQVTSPGTLGVSLIKGGTFTNKETGKITIGSLVQAAKAIFANSATSSVVQNGQIEINGQISGNQTQQNTGIESYGASNVTNNGTITLNGINAQALYVHTSPSTGLTNSIINNTGEIILNKGMDAVTKTLNYGIYAEGLNAVANHSGNVILNGDRAIGIHARNQGQVNVADEGKVTFNSGENQVGYYIYGAGSGINNATTSTQSVSTKGSTLYRMGGGANFTGSTTTQAHMSADGENSTILLATGKSEDQTTASQLSTGGIELNVNGKGATAVRAEGGAQAVINAETKINLHGSQTTAGIVDGQSTTITGQEDSAGNSQLTSYATLNDGNTARDAIGYIARNNGTLIHRGLIGFASANSTGVLVNGGTLDNRSTINVNGIAVDIQGANSSVDNSGTVTAVDGVAAYRVGKNASLALTGTGSTNAAGTAHGVLLDTEAKGLSVTDATINVSGSGNAIENKAEISGIRLNRTTLNVTDGAGVRTGASMALTNSGIINVNGSGTGILLANVDGSDTSTTMDMFDSHELVINVNSAQGAGIITRTSGEIRTGTSVNVNDSNGGPALSVKGTTKAVEQYGKLTSASLVDPVVDISNDAVTRFQNNGDILAHSADQIALEQIRGSGVIFANNNGANIVGHVNLLSGNNTVNLNAGSTGTDFTTGAGNDVFNLKDVTQSDTQLFTSLNGGAGDDVLKLDNSQYRLSQKQAITGIENIQLTNGSTFEQDHVLLGLGDSEDDNPTTGFAISHDSELALKNSTDVAFKSHLAGTGTLSTDLSGRSLNFTANNVGDNFAGTVDLHNTLFALEGVNTTALSSALLNVSEGSLVNVGNGKQTLSGLAFNDGTVNFGAVNPGLSKAENTVFTSDKLDISQHGNVQVGLTSVLNDNPLPASHLPLTSQDDGLIQLKLADSAGSVIGSGGNLALIDANGNTISNNQQLDITQLGETVAKGTWDYRLTSGDNADGLYVNYGLTEVDLLGTGTSSLVLASDSTGTAADLSAKITGSGDLHADTGAGNSVTLSNLDNNYHGKTNVLSGTLAMNNSGALGNTTALNVLKDAAFDLKGTNQHAGALNTQAGSKVNLGQGSQLTIDGQLRNSDNRDGGTIAGSTLQGNGKLVIDPSDIKVTGANHDYTGNVDLKEGSQATLNNVSGLGDSGTITLDTGNDKLLFATLLTDDAPVTGNLSKQLSGKGTVVLNDSADITLKADNGAFSGEFLISKASTLRVSDPTTLGSAAIKDDGKLLLTTDRDWTLQNSVTGSGKLEKSGNAHLTVNQDLTYTGTTDILAGTLIVGDGTADAALSGGSSVNIAQNATLTGLGEVSGIVNNQGAITALNALSDAFYSDASHFTIGGLNNNGSINLAGKEAGNTLTIKGDYHGNNGLLTLNTVLGKDDSLTDKLIVEGSTSGDTRVKVNNMGGNGALTSQGIEIVSVGGDSDGKFALEGRAVAGAWEYFLNKDEKNWYLQTVKNDDPDTPVVPDPQTPPDTPEPPTIRPEAGAYTANIAAANTMFVHTLRDREGENRYIDPITGESKVTSMWMRNIGGHNRFHDNTGQLKTQSNRYVVQFGGEVAQGSSNGEDSIHLGVMAGYGNNQSNTRSHVTGYHADGQVNGYNLGIYGTWLQNNAEKTGGWVDIWAQYGWFNNTVKGQDLATEKYKSNGFTGSVETGYTAKMGEFKTTKGSTNEWFVEPHAQAVWMGVSADKHIEENGTSVSSQGKGNVMTRLGVRTWIKGHSTLDKGKDRDFQPFIEANWIHNTRSFGVNMNDITSNQAGTKNIAEVKVGVEGKINSQLNIWGNVTNQIGDKGYSDSSAMIGVKYNFK